MIEFPTPAPEYQGPAVIGGSGDDITVTVTLSGHHDPIDGRYHWYGRVVGDDRLPEPGRIPVTLTLPGGAPTSGRLEERDPWGNLRIVGIGAPPYTL